jgi:hypothetical protein
MSPEYGSPTGEEEMNFTAVAEGVFGLYPRLPYQIFG